MAARAQTTFAQHLREVPPPTRPILSAARKVIVETMPAATEVPYQSKRPVSPSTMWKIARYTSGGEEVCGVGVFREHVNLYFYRGLDIDDPQRLLAGGGKAMRSVSLRSVADARSPHVRRLLEEAFRLAGRA